jgi:hypothetical protein
MIHPYIFVLKEGSDIEKDRLDYSLMMLKIGPAEHFPSPTTLKKEVAKDKNSALASLFPKISN